MLRKINKMLVAMGRAVRIGSLDNKKRKSSYFAYTMNIMIWNTVGCRRYLFISLSYIVYLRFSLSNVLQAKVL